MRRSWPQRRPSLEETYRKGRWNGSERVLLRLVGLRAWHMWLTSHLYLIVAPSLSVTIDQR